MRLIVFAAGLAVATSVFAQTQAPATPVQKPMATQPSMPGRIRQAPPANAAARSAKAVDVPPTTPVVTLNGICKVRQAGGACKTVITREDLDRFVAAFAGDPSEKGRERMAAQYARTLAFSSLAEQQGLDKNADLAKEIEAEMKFVRMRLLATAFLQNLQRQPVPVTDGEVQRYYEIHRDQYETAEVLRLSVPFAVPTETGRPLDRAAVKAELEQLHARAAAGEDLNELQKEAYQDLHIQATPPAVSPMPMRRTGVQGDETKVFGLKPGEMTDVLDLAASFGFIKLQAVQTVPIESLRGEIESAIRRDRTQNDLGKLTKNVKPEFNSQYLDMSSQPDIFAMTSVTRSPRQANVRRRQMTQPATQPAAQQ